METYDKSYSLSSQRVLRSAQNKPQTNRWLLRCIQNAAAYLMAVTLYAAYEEWIGLIKCIHEAMQ